MEIRKFLDIFTTILLILLIVFDVYLLIDNVILKKVDVESNVHYSDEAKNFDGEYVKEYGYINTAQKIVNSYIDAIKQDNSQLDILLIDSIKKDTNVYSSIANEMGENIYIQEVKINNSKTEMLIKYSTNEDENDINIMLCKLDITKATFIICYDSNLEGV